MSAGNASPTGPDLAAGVELQDVPDGGMLAGHVGDDAVLLARRGDEVFAIGATCSHYGGPLQEGLLTGNTVHCPWHHACFDIRTGEAIAAPALSPVPCWNVTRSGTRVLVSDKRERDPLEPAMPERVPPRSIATDVRRIAILGAGAAGSAAAEMLRRSGFDGSITMVDGESEAPYDRPNLSKDYLAGTAEEAWIPLRPDGFYADHDIEIVRGRCTRIDVADRRLEIDGHAPVSFDRLLIATGAEPVHLPIPGSELPFVHYLRSLADSRALIAAATADGTTRVVIVGASFIGLEVAASLRARDLEVHVVAPESVPLERVMGTAIGTLVQSIHANRGVHFHLGRKPARIEAGAVVLDDDTRLEAELVVIGVGVKPRLQLAEAAGLDIDRGVRVDAYLESSVPGVFAAGDIARWPDARSGDAIRVEHWVVAQRMGQTAARNMLGARERFTDVPFFWSAHYDTTIAYVGHAEAWDTVRIDGSLEAGDVKVEFVQRDTVLAVATVGRDEASLRAEVAMARPG